MTNSAVSSQSPSEQFLIPKTPHFNLMEFHCKDGTLMPTTYYPAIQKLMNILEIVRTAVAESKGIDPRSPKARLSVLSGWRTISHNKAVGGKPRSRHLVAEAADLVSACATPYELHRIILKLIRTKTIPDGGLALYRTWVHYDYGPSRRWKDNN